MGRYRYKVFILAVICFVLAFVAPKGWICGIVGFFLLLLSGLLSLVKEAEKPEDWKKLHR